MGGSSGERHHGQVPFPHMPSSWHVCPCPEQCPPCSGYHERQLACRKSSQPSGAVSTGCKYNQVNSHFHCIREGCQFSFLLKHQMTSHARKHMRRMLGKNFDRAPSSQVSRPSPAWGPEGIIRVPLWQLPKVTTCPLWAAPPPAQLAQGPPASFQGPPSLMDTETDEYMDYTGCSPGAMSSESSTMDRSCSSTPVGNESTAAGEQAARRGPQGSGRCPAWDGPSSHRVWLRTGASWPSGLKGGQASVWPGRLVCGTWVPTCCRPAHLPCTLPLASISRRGPGFELRAIARGAGGPHPALAPPLASLPWSPAQSLGPRVGSSPWPLPSPP